MADTFATDIRRPRPMKQPAASRVRTPAGPARQSAPPEAGVKPATRELLRSVPNRVTSRYSVRIETPELTFLGASSQPDFARLVIDYIPRAQLIELKSLKQYVGSFRDRHLSYELLANLIRDDIEAVFSPRLLRVTLSFQPSGGTSTTVTVPAEGEEDPYEAWAQSHGAPR